MPTRKKNIKHSYKENIKKLIAIDVDEYDDEVNEVFCGCDCVICNPYHGDFWAAFDVYIPLP